MQRVTITLCDNNNVPVATTMYTIDDQTKLTDALIEQRAHSFAAEHSVWYGQGHINVEVKDDFDNVIDHWLVIDCPQRPRSQQGDIVKKITHGYVIQYFDRDTKTFFKQEFIAGDDIEFVDEFDNPIKPIEDLYHQFEMEW